MNENSSSLSGPSGSSGNSDREQKHNVITAKDDDEAKAAAAERAATSLRSNMRRILLGGYTRQDLFIFILECQKLFERALNTSDLISIDFWRNFAHNLSLQHPEVLLRIVIWMLQVFESKNRSIESFLQDSQMIAEIMVRLTDYRQILESDVQLASHRYVRIIFVGGAQPDQAMPPITPASDEFPFNPISSGCAICLDPLYGECHMSQCRHAFHEGCMKKMFKEWELRCPLCREKTNRICSATLEEPNALGDSSVDHSRSSKASEDPSAGAPAESPKTPEE